MSLLKPAALKPGATFGIVSPASTPRTESVSAGRVTLGTLGFKSKLFPHALARGPLYYAGTPAQRAADLHAAFADPEVDAVLCTRGGWGSAELLPLLDRALIRAHPKPFLGYSDLTTLHLWLRNEAEIVSFQAPMLAADFSKEHGVDLASWRAALLSSSPWHLGPESGLRVLRPGVAEGELSGGCLAIFAESLGTAWAARPRHGVLMLEDIDVKPYQWDRMLVHLRHAGILECVTGIVFGDMAQCKCEGGASAIEDSLLYALRDFTGPIAIGLRSGHVERSNITLPFGVQARLDLRDADEPRLSFLEASVSA
jgi:muramoyltetrapeptide carboxypeptidase